MKLIVFLLIIRYLLRLFPASMIGGALIAEEIDERSKQREPGPAQSEEQTEKASSCPSTDRSAPSA